MGMQNLHRALFDSYMKAQESGIPAARYIKTIVGKVVVTVVDPFSGQPSEIVLQGKPAKENLDRVVITLWTPFEHEFFRRTNKILLDSGVIAPYTEEIIEEISVNEISDEEIKDILSKKYFALMNLLSRVTSPEVVKRILRIAEEENKQIGTINKIKERLSELQKTGD